MTARAIALVRHLAGFVFAPAVAPVSVLAYELFRMSTAERAPAGAAMVAFTSSLSAVALLAGLAAGLAAGVSGAYCAVAGVPVRPRAVAAVEPPLT